MAVIFNIMLILRSMSDISTIRYDVCSDKFLVFFFLLLFFKTKSYSVT